MAYSILLAPPAEHHLRSFAPAIQKRLVKLLKALRENPRQQGVKKLAREDDLYRFREGDFRIIYAIQDKKLIVLVLKIGDRKKSIARYHSERSQAALIDAEKVDPDGGTSPSTSLHYAGMEGITRRPSAQYFDPDLFLEKCGLRSPIPLLLTSRPPPVA